MLRHEFEVGKVREEEIVPLEHPRLEFAQERPAVASLL
jgi:hypothetical protein